MSLLAKANSIWRVPLILLWTAVMASLSVVSSLFDGTGTTQHGCARIWGRFIVAVSRVRVEVRGLERVEDGRGYLLAANHLSMFDHWALLSCLPFQFRFVSKESLFRVPFLGWHLRRSGTIPVARNNPRRTLRSFRKAAKLLKGGLSYVIYPEGGRSWGEGVDAFKSGSLLLARYGEAPILPVTIIGAHRRLLRGSMLIYPGSMELIFHPPLEFEEYKDMDSDEVANSVRRIISASYHQVP